MKRDIKTVLHALGVSRSYQGYAYFIEAVRMAAEDPCRLTRVREKIYLPIASRNHTTIFNVEKNLRTVRDVIVRNNGQKILVKWTGASFLRNATPYPRELIELFADNYILSEEGPEK